jgi:hypothetical protein
MSVSSKNLANWSKKLEAGFKLLGEGLLLLSYMTYVYLEYFYITVFPPSPKSLRNEKILVRNFFVTFSK